MAIPTVRGLGTADSGVGAITPTLPASSAADDILLMVVEASDGDTIDVPTGWAHVTGSPWTLGSGGTGSKCALLWKRHDGSETDPTLADAGDHCYARIIGFVGAVTTGEPFYFLSQDTASASTTITWPSINTTVDDCLIINVCWSPNPADGLAQVTGSANASLSSVTERMDIWRTSGNDGGFVMVTGGLATAGSSGSTTATLEDSMAQLRVTMALVSVAPSGAQDLTPSLFTNSQTFPAATVAPGAVDLTPSLVTNSQTFHAATVASTYDLAPSLVTNTPTFPSATVAPGAVDLTPSLFSNAQAFYSATVALSAQDLTPSLFTNSQTFPAATVSATYDLAPALFTSGQTFYAATVSASIDLAPALATNSQSFPSATVASTYDLQPALVTNSAAFYSPSVTATADLAPALVTNSQTFPAATVSPGAVDIAPSLFSNSVTFFAPIVAGTYELTAPLLTNSSSFPAATVTTSNALAPALFANDNTFYGATIGGGAQPRDATVGRPGNEQFGDRIAAFMPTRPGTGQFIRRASGFPVRPRQISSGRR